MLKEVEANGQIALGEQFAGRRYDLQFHADGRVELLPVPSARAQTAGAMGESVGEWARQNAAAIEQYNVWVSQRDPYAQRVRRWRAAQPD